MFGKNHSETTLLKMSTSRTKRTGELSPNPRLTVKEVLEIRALYKNKVLGQIRLAKKFGVSKGCIQNIVEYRTWKSVE